MELAGRRILVLGLGLSGRSAANFCLARGAEVVAADEAERAALAGLDEIDPGVELMCGGPLPDPADFDIVVPSPGVARERYAERAAVVWGDIELAGRALGVPVVAVTGTNGKSTTVRLVEAMLEAAGLRARAAGNVGTPALSLVGQPLDVAVLEVSSFQLETTERFRPKVSVILNLSPDHLDRHGDFAGYVEAKSRIFANQQTSDVCILNFDDPAVSELAPRVRADLLPFSTRKPLTRGVFLDGTALIVAREERTLRLPLDGIRVPAGHGRENLLAALAVVAALEVDLQQSLQALPAFQGLPHRCEVVAERAGVTWINDSKATNPGAARFALESQDAPVIWIAGGRDKGLDFAELADVAAARAKCALLIGESAADLGSALAGRIPAERLPDLPAAVERAAELAQSGDVVLLSPACASFDQFRSFEARGDCFREAVSSLQRGAAKP